MMASDMDHGIRLNFDVKSSALPRPMIHLPQLATCAMKILSSALTSIMLQFHMHVGPSPPSL